MSRNTHKANKLRREWLRASTHVLNGALRDSGPDGPGEYLDCSCGWVSPGLACWHDDCVLSDLAKWGHTPAIVVYPDEARRADLSLGGIVRVAANGRGRRIPARDMSWLADQPGVPTVLRDAAAQAAGPHEGDSATIVENEDDLTVTIDGIVVDGWLDGASCDVCSGPIVFDERYDAEFCSHCNRWTSPECDDPACDFCPHRPQPPLNRKALDT